MHPKILETILIVSTLTLMTACGGSPLAQPETATPVGPGQRTPTASAETTGEAAGENQAATPTVGLTPVVTETQIPAQLNGKRTTDPEGIVYAADKIELVPFNLNLSPESLSTKDTEPKIGFNSWSNSGQKFAFRIPSPEVLIDPTVSEVSNTYTGAELWIANIDGSDPQKIADRTGSLVLWSPDDAHLAYYKRVGVSKHELWVADLNTKSLIKLDEPDGININDTDFYNPIDWFDNRYLLFSTYSKAGQYPTIQRHLWLHDVQNGQIEEVEVDERLDNNWVNLYLAPNKTLIVGDTLHELWLGELVEENEQLRLEYTEALIAENGLIPYWSPDSTKLAVISFGRFDNTLRVIDIGSKQMTEISFRLQVADVQWSPDSRSMIVINHPSGNSPTTPVYVVNADGSNLRLLLDEFPIGFAQWSPDGQYLVLRSEATRYPAHIAFDLFKIEVGQ